MDITYVQAHNFYTEQLTGYSESNFAQKIAAEINKDFPKSAVVVVSENLTACFISTAYYSDCIQYAKDHCKTKQQTNERTNASA
jgi:hypothetical protein